jgi:hypothetical protein
MSEAKRKEFTLRLEDEDAEEFRRDAFEVRAKNQEILYRSWKFWRAHGRPLNTTQETESTEFPQTINKNGPDTGKLLSSLRTNPVLLSAFLDVLLRDPAMRDVIAERMDAQVAIRPDVESHRDTTAPPDAATAAARSSQSADRGPREGEIERAVEHADEMASELAKDLDDWRRDHERDRKRDRKAG